jgi:hypothetical protein
MWKRTSALCALVVLCVALGWAATAQAQNSSFEKFGGLHLDTAVQALRTEAETEAVGFVFDLFKNPDEIFATNCLSIEIQTGRCNFGRSTGWLFDLAPDVHVNTGNDEAFQSIVAKVSGNFMVFSLEQRTDISPIPIPDPSKLVHVFPISAGIETDNNADTLNAVAELGYVPFKFSGGTNFVGNNLRLGINPRVGFFLQGGDKLRDETKTGSGGSKDDSSEEQGKGIGRLKSVAEMDLLFPLRLLGAETGLQLQPSATGWYDFINNQFYYSLKLSVGLALLGSGGERSTLWEFTIQEGSGEPNFTQGTQYGTGLKLQY